ncbi:MAG: glucokinase [Pseudomonadota bacterium]
MPSGKRDQTSLVADIGGTNARFAIMDPSGHVVRAGTRRVADYATFHDALEAFLAAGDQRPGRAGFAVAGPVTGGQAAFTNSPWTIDQRELQSEDGFSACIVINDFAALGAYALGPPREDLLEIKPGRPLASAPVLVIGPGTGLGISLAVPDGDRAVTVATEGGHAVLAATNSEEAALIDLATEELGRPTTREDILSGSGLERLHRVRMKYLDQTATNCTAVEITEGAISGHEFHRATVEQFLLFLATSASNAALATGARQGVLIGGGILPRFREVVLESGFADRFVGESPMADYLREIPVHLIVAGDAALRGAFMALRRIHS